VAKFDWSADYCAAVSRFCAQADHIRRRMKNAGAVTAERRSERIAVRR